MVWALARRIATKRRVEQDDFSGFSGVTAHENGLFLYKSPQAEDYLQTRLVDYFIAGCGLGWLTGCSSFLFLPFAASMFSMPRKVA
jgi:hypothetical protein